MPFRTRKRVAVAALSVLATASLAACSGAGGGGAGAGGAASQHTINVIMVNNPQMKDLQSLTEKNFTGPTGIKVNYTVLPENEVRNKIAQEFANQSGQYDVASLSNFEVPIYSKNGWLAPLDQVSGDAAFDQSDIIPALSSAMTGTDGKVYGEPFYGESSFLMYRKDVFKKKGLTMPENPTWDQVADLAAKVDGAEPRMKGICLRGQPGWGQVFAPLNTVVNTFGGQWFDMSWNPTLTAPAFQEAVQFYVDLLQKHGEVGAPQAGFLECLNSFQQGGTAMWYDATANAPLVEGDDSPIKGKVGFVAAPVKQTKASGWLYSWAWGVEKASKNSADAQKFIAWASGKDYENQAGSQLGWTHVPAGKRTSTYSNPEYTKVAADWYEQELAALQGVDPKNPGVAPRPYTGVQFVAIPEFPDLGTKVSQEVSAAIAGKTSVSDALAASQKLAEPVGVKQRG